MKPQQRYQIREACGLAFQFCIEISTVFEPQPTFRIAAHNDTSLDESDTGWSIPIIEVVVRKSSDDERDEMIQEAWTDEDDWDFDDSTWYE